VPPSGSPPVGTPTLGGPGPNLGPPGGDDAPSPTDIGTLIETDSTGGKCAANAETLGDPVFPGIGNTYQEEVDYRGPHGLNVVRGYNSSLPGWVHNFGMRVLANATTAKIVRPDGRSVTFTGSGTGVWTSEAATREQLIRLSPTNASQPLWQYNSAQDGIEFYDQQGRLMSFTRRGGLSYTVQRAGTSISAVTDAFGHQLQYRYDSGGRLAQVITPEGTTITYGYDAQGRLASVSYPDGTARQYLYENPSYSLALTGVIDERGLRTSTWSYDAGGRVMTSERAGALRYQFQYNADGSTTYYDPLGTTRTQAYVLAGSRRLFAGQNQPCANCVGDAASNLVDAATGLITQSTDFLGTTTQFAIDTSRRLPVAVTRAANRPEAQTVQVQWHASLHLPVLVTEPGRSTAYSYDSAGNLLSRTVTDTATGQARTWQWTYTAQGLALTFTDPRGSTWTYGYDGVGNRISITDPLNRQTTFAYDAAGRITSETDPSGLATTFTYDARGRLTSQSRGGETSTFSYTANGQLANATQPDGYQVTYAYDAAQRLIAASDNRGASVAYTLDAMGNRVHEEVKDGNGNIALATTRMVNSLNRLAAVQGALGQTTGLAYDVNGQLLASTDPLNQTTRRALDGLGRTTATTFADNSSVQQAWSALNALTQVIDPKGVKTQYATNAFGDVVSETSPDIGAITYQRDAAGSVAASTDAKGNTAQITRDALGRITQIQYPDQTQTFSYDAQGNVSRIDDGSGSIAYTRDSQGRVLLKTQTVNDVSASPTQLKVQYSYTSGDLTSVHYPSGLQVSYKRVAGRITEVDVQAPSTASGKAKPVTVLASNFTYTALGQPKSWTWFNGDSVSRSFDADGRMTANEFAMYGYDAASRITTVTQLLWATRGASTGSPQMYQAPITWSASYDSRNRVVGLSRAGQTTSFTYDANGNRLSRMEIAVSDVDLDGQFDAPGFALTTSETPAVDITSNRLLGFSVTTTTGNGAKSSTSSSQVNYTVDANGSMTSDGLRKFVYDASGRLSKVEAVNNGDAVGVEYLTNALGQRVFKSDPIGEGQGYTTGAFGDGFIGWLKVNFGWLFTPGQSRNRLGLIFMYDEQGNLLSTTSDGSSAAANQQMDIIWLPKEDGTAIPVGVYKSGQFYAVHTDHLGTPRLITDSANTPTWQWPYSAFGNNKPTGVLQSVPASGQAGGAMLKATAPAVEFNLRFAGQYFDSESNLAYNYHRFYQPSQGRYTQADLIGLAGGLSRFAYAGANPISRIDPRGLDIVVVTGGTRDGSVNIAGHSAVGVTGAGIFSYGNQTPLGSSVESYVSSQANDRDQVITIIPTTLAQDAAALRYLLEHPGMNGVGYIDNCAARTSGALTAAGFDMGTSLFPRGVGRDAANLPGAQTYTVPQGTSAPASLTDALKPFAPPNVP
jgi:RHS repeat-associated protein